MPFIANRKNGYLVLTETIITKSGSVTTSGEFVVPPGRDFSVIANYDATNLSTSTHVEMQISDVAGGTFIRRNTAGFNATTALIDNATKHLFWDVSADFQNPVYKFKFPVAGGAVKMVVTVGEKIVV